MSTLAVVRPTVNTKLDPQPTTRVHKLQVVQIIDEHGMDVVASACLDSVREIIDAISP